MSKRVLQRCTNQKVSIIDKRNGKEPDSFETDQKWSMPVLIQYKVIGVSQDLKNFICDNGWWFKIDPDKYEVINV